MSRNGRKGIGNRVLARVFAAVRMAWAAFDDSQELIRQAGREAVE